MDSVESTLHRMATCCHDWQCAGDRRHIFLQCYRMMSANMAEAIGRGEFNDPDWVSRLLVRFSEYYFDALDKYETDPASAPSVWRQVHDASRDSRLHVLQHLLLGVNAHINYDLSLSLYDCLCDSWSDADGECRRKRFADHEKVNEVIAATIDAVQDEVVEPHSPVMAVVDRAFGRLDEWMLSRLISGWRADVWQVATGLLDAAGGDARETLRSRQEARVLRRGKLLQRLA